MGEFIDLSANLNERTPVYPGDPETQIKQAGVLNRDGYNDHSVCIGTHVGTHMDAPLHMVSNGKTLDQMPIDQFVGHGVLIEVVNKKFDINQVTKLDIQAGDIVLFWTGMSDDYNNSSYMEDYPAIPEEIAEYLVSKKISMLGVDMCSPDHEPFPVHKILLNNDILIVENLINLKQLKGKEFKVYALPIKLQIDGAPARVIAELK